MHAEVQGLGVSSENQERNVRGVGLRDPFIYGGRQERGTATGILWVRQEN